MMRKTLLLTAGILFLSGMAMAQERVLLNFETNMQGTFGDCFGAGSLNGPGCYGIVANPDNSGINGSDSVAMYIEPAEDQPWMGMFFDMDKTFKVTGDSSSLCIKVYMPNTEGVVLKLEQVDTFGNPISAYEPPTITNTVTNGWEDICFDYAGTAIDGVEVNRIAVFFNIDEVPAVSTTYYFDDILQPGATGIYKAKFGGFIKAYPNPTRDILRIGTDFTHNQTIKVSDITGREVMRLEGTRETELQVGHLNSGVYFLSVMDESTQVVRTSKFVKE